MSKLHTIKTKYKKLKKYYDSVLNSDDTFRNSNDECTPMDCVEEMVNKLDAYIDWSNPKLKILDPCVGNGNFMIYIYQKLIKYHNTAHILNKMLYFIDINEDRIDNIKHIFHSKNVTKRHIYNYNFLEVDFMIKFDLIVANPPYALITNTKRASKNHNLIKLFLEKSLDILKPNGLLMYITPDNWMSLADRNTLITRITSLELLYLNIHTAKKYFKKIGSSFTWYIIRNTQFNDNSPKVQVDGLWLHNEYTSHIQQETRNYIPLFYTKTINNILKKTIDLFNEKFKIQTSSFLHKYTKRHLISTEKDENHKYKLIHTPTQIVYSSKPHKFQQGYKVFISTTTNYQVFVDKCGMTQSIAFIMCDSKKEAKLYKKILEHPLYIFLNNICRYGNFNNIRILQKFPIPPNLDYDLIWNDFNITKKEQKYIITRQSTKTKLEIDF